MSQIAIQSLTHKPGSSGLVMSLAFNQGIPGADGQGALVVAENPPIAPTDGFGWHNLQNGLLYVWHATLGVWISNFTSGVEVDPPPPGDSPTIYIAPTGEAYTFEGEVYTIPN